MSCAITFRFAGPDVADLAFSPTLLSSVLEGLGSDRSSNDGSFSPSANEHSDDWTLFDDPMDTSAWLSDLLPWSDIVSRVPVEEDQESICGLSDSGDYENMRQRETAIEAAEIVKPCIQVAEASSAPKNLEESWKEIPKNLEDSWKEGTKSLEDSWRGSDVSASELSGVAEGSQLQDGKFPLCPGGRCSHKDDWTRVRGKRAYAYFFCRYCGLGWRACRPKAPAGKAHVPEEGDAVECSTGDDRPGLLE